MVSVRRTLDTQGQPTAITQSAGGSSRTISYTYDLLGRKTTETSPEGIVTAYAYTPQGQVSGIHGGVYQQEYYYDDHGQLAHLITYQDENTPQVTTFTYDNGGRLTEKTYADNTHEYYSYRNDGKIHEYTNCRGHIHTFSYGLAGELTGIYSDAGLNRSYEYNQLGQLTKVADNLGEFELEYDNYGNLITEVFPDGTSAGRSYDNFQRLTDISLNSTMLATFSYGSDGRMHSISNGVAEMTYSYLSGSSLVSERSWKTDENTPFLGVNKQYDHFARLIGVTANNQPQIAYELDRDNQRISAELTDNTKWQYSYDRLSQLTGATRKDGEIPLNELQYAYDMIGNRLNSMEDSDEKEYTTNLLNQYIQVGEDECEYDIDGNMLNNRGWAYTWNTENRLIKAEKNNMRLEFAYDYLGRRAYKKVYENNVLVKHEKYIYLDYKLIALYDELNNNALLKTFIWQPDNIDLDIPVCISENNNLYYYVADGNKNITRLFDNQGNQMASYTYSPFGKVLGSSGILAQVNPLRFSSEFHDDETGLAYYNYRYYDPILGRWTKRDPIGEQGGVNLYGMIGNNIINGIDILGYEKLNNKIMSILQVRTTWLIAIPLVSIVVNWATTSKPQILVDEEKEIEGILPFASMSKHLRDLIKKENLPPNWKRYEFKRINIATFGDGNVLTMAGNFPSTGWWLNQSAFVYASGIYEARCHNGKKEWRNVKLIYEWHDNIDANSYIEAMNKGAFDHYFSGSTYINTIEGAWDLIMEKIFAVDFKVIIKGNTTLGNGATENE